MTNRSMLRIAGSVALVLLLAAPAAAQSAGDTPTLRTAARPPGPQRYLGLPYRHPARTSGGARRSGVLLGGGERRVRRRAGAGQQRRPRPRGAETDNHRPRDRERYPREPRPRPRLQRLLVGPRGQRRRDPAYLARHRSAQRPDSRVDRGGRAARGRARAAQPAADRGAGGPPARRALHHRLQLGAADAAGRLQHERADLPDARPRRAAERDGAQRADHPARRQRSRHAPAVDRSVARALGRRHPGRRDEELPARDQLPGTPARTCTWSSASGGWTRTACSTPSR